jgi:LysM repeat protein
MMSPEKNASKTKLCPVCGTRLNESATRCLVCGTEIDLKADTKKNAEVRAKRLPEITLSLPAALGLLALFITLGAVIVFLVLNSGVGAEAEEIAELEGTATPSPTITTTPTSTLTPTLEPTWTPLPPIEYVVQAGDVCSGLAAFFGVSIQSIILENNLSTDCVLNEGDTLMIPQPTPTASPQPTATLGDVEKTEEACEKAYHTVTDTDTLSYIADLYDVSITVIKEYNGLTSDTVYEDTVLTIPLCMREPTAGPTATPTTPPPYPAPNLLLPADGTSFTEGTSTITLQWAAVGELEANEAYAVTITDLTSDTNHTETFYVTDTSLIVPSSFAPGDGQPHVYRWFVFVARQLGSDEDVEGNWVSGGDESIQRVFSWFGEGLSPTMTPTP